MLQQVKETTALTTPGFRLLTADVVDLTPDVLKEFRGLDASATERELDKTRVKYLNDKVIDGLAVSFRWATAKLNGKTIRINGQHSSIMLEQMLSTLGQMPPGLKVLREHFEVRDLDSVALLFQQYDARGSSRDVADIAGVYQAIHDELNEIPRPIGRLAIEAYVWFQRSVQQLPNIPVGDGVYTLFGDHGLYPYIKWLAELHTVKTKELKNKAVMAAAFGTFETNERGARDFWDSVSRGGDPDEEDQPESVLDKWLIEMTDPKKRPDGFGVKNLYQGCVYAWNAVRDNKRINSIRHDVKKSFSPIKE